MTWHRDLGFMSKSNQKYGDGTRSSGNSLTSTFKVPVLHLSSHKSTLNDNDSEIVHLATGNKVKNRSTSG